MTRHDEASAMAARLKKRALSTARMDRAEKAENGGTLYRHYIKPVIGIATDKRKAPAGMIYRPVKALEWCFPLNFVRDVKNTATGAVALVGCDEDGAPLIGAILQEVDSGAVLSPGGHLTHSIHYESLAAYIKDDHECPYSVARLYPEGDRLTPPEIDALLRKDARQRAEIMGIEYVPPRTALDDLLDASAARFAALGISLEDLEDEDLEDEDVEGDDVIEEVHEKPADSDDLFA